MWEKEGFIFGKVGRIIQTFSFNSKHIIFEIEEKNICTVELVISFNDFLKTTEKFKFINGLFEHWIVLNFQ